MLFIDHLFPGCDVLERGVFRLIRDSDIEIEEEAEDLVMEFEEALKQSRLGSVVRVKIDATKPEDMRSIIINELNAAPQSCEPCYRMMYTARSDHRLTACHS